MIVTHVCFYGVWWKQTNKQTIKLSWQCCNTASAGDKINIIWWSSQLCSSCRESFSTWSVFVSLSVFVSMCFSPEGFATASQEQQVSELFVLMGLCGRWGMLGGKKKTCQGTFWQNSPAAKDLSRACAVFVSFCSSTDGSLSLLAGWLQPDGRSGCCPGCWKLLLSWCCSAQLILIFSPLCYSTPSLAY